MIGAQGAKTRNTERAKRIRAGRGLMKQLDEILLNLEVVRELRRPSLPPAGR